MTTAEIKGFAFFNLPPTTSSFLRMNRLLSDMPYKYYVCHVRSHVIAGDVCQIFLVRSNMLILSCSGSAIAQDISSCSMLILTVIYIKLSGILKHTWEGTTCLNYFISIII